MKKISLIISLLILSVFYVSAQNVAYILPDIGAPGMNTYIEIIAHVDSVDTYGPDKTYWGEAGDDLKLVFENPADTNDVVVGPLIVSWDGRLISTQIFVNPDLKPNTADWEILRSEFNKRFAVEYKGSRSSFQDFYVLRPTKLGNVVYDPSRYLGEGSLGKRSPRGAMIVDSLILADDTYYPSLEDCDPSTPGNQAYLPFILMAKHKIKGFVNTKIDVSGGKLGQNTTPQDAGPGGGGGAGGFLLYLGITGSKDEGKRAGNGFTCGGVGGSSRIWTPQNKYFISIDSSKSTSDSGFSLNRVGGGVTKLPNIAEAGGGGTGHPFGKSGDGVDLQDDKTKIGQYGGGSSYSNDENGGSGGYGKVGTGPGNTGGKVHGNTMIVPLAGGSGGAAGNPHTASEEWGGSGGGGGGAIRLYAREIVDVEIKAIGGNGETADEAEGGNGSGGAIELSANTRTNNIKIDVSGGNEHSNNGGCGYIKINSANLSAIIDGTNDGLPIYNSVSSDSLQYVPRVFTLTGTKGSGKDIKLMFKVGHNPWQDVTASATVNDEDWSLDFDLTPYMTDEFFYFYAFQDENAVGVSEYLNVPDGVLSQSAANIFVPVDEAQLGGDKNVYLTAQACPGSQVIRTSQLWNENTVAIDIDFASAVFKRKIEGLELSSPTGLEQLPDYNSTVDLTFTYNYQPGASGTLRDTLLVPYTDAKSGKNEIWEVYITIFIDEYDFTIYDEDIKVIDFDSGDELHLGNICPDGSAQKMFYIHNDSDLQVSFENFGLTSPGIGFDIEVLSSGPLSKDERASIMVRFDDLDPTVSKSEVRDTVYFNLTECPEIKDSVIVVIQFLNPSLTANPNFDFGAVRVGETSTITTTLRNEGSSDIYISSLPAVAPPFTIVSYSPSPLPINLKQGDDMLITLEYAPTIVADDSRDFIIQTEERDDACAISMNIPITASSYESAIELSKDTLNFGIVAECDILLDTLIFSNKPVASGDVVISKIPEIKGADAALFNLISYPQPPLSLAPGEDREYIVEFDAKTASPGVYNAELYVYTDEPNMDSLIIIPIIAERDEFAIDFETVPTPYGIVKTGKTFTGTIDITNNSKLPRNASLITSDNIEAMITPATYLFAAGETKQFDLEITYSDTTDFDLELKLMFDSPCLDSAKQVLNIEVRYGLAEIDTAIDLDTLAPCNIKSDTVFVRNVGTDDIELRDVVLNGVDFSLIEAPAMPVSIAPGDSNFVIVEFDANGKADGTYIESLDFTIFEYGKENIHTTMLTAVTKSAVLATPDAIDFGNVIEGYESDERLLTISNTGTYDVVILEVIFPDGADYTISYEELFPNGPAENYPLPIGEEISYNLKFIPDNIDLYSGEILIVIQYADCVDTISVTFSAEGVPDNILTLTLPAMLVDPAAPSVEIPLQASTSKFEITTKLDSLSVVYDRNVIKLLGIDNAAYDTYQTLDTMTIVLKDSTYYTVGTEFQTVLNIYAMPLLGHIEKTDLLISYTPKTGEKISEVIERDGEIALDICKEGGDRLLVQANRTDLLIEPNPAGEMIKVNAYLQEIGEYSFELYDLSGKRIYEKSIENTIFAGTEKTLEISTKNIGSGEYMMMLVAPSLTISKKVVVIK